MTAAGVSYFIRKICRSDRSLWFPCNLLKSDRNLPQLFIDNAGCG
ncbi:hypothetical protein [Komarekiella delphini-convector]|nr:hypothetical protein [Komarekiella delphini-convector]